MFSLVYHTICGPICSRSEAVQATLTAGTHHLSLLHEVRVASGRLLFPISRSRLLSSSLRLEKERTLLLVVDIIDRREGEEEGARRAANRSDLLAHSCPRYQDVGRHLSSSSNPRHQFLSCTRLRPFLVRDMHIGRHESVTSQETLSRVAMLPF